MGVCHDDLAKPYGRWFQNDVLARIIGNLREESLALVQPGDGP